MEQKTSSINLLRNRQGEFLGKFMDWALTIGRFLVMATELIALSAFLYRFSLDRALIDLHSKIKQEELYIKALKNNEDKYRNLQDRIALASNFSNNGIQKIQIFQDVLNFTPIGLNIDNIIVNESTISINAVAQNTSSLNLFTNSLKTYPKLKKLNLNSIYIKPSSGLIVSFTANF